MTTFKEMQDKYPALSLKECEDYSEMGATSEMLSHVNDKHKKAIDEKVAGFIPERVTYGELPTNLNIMFLGKTGSGKSSTGNMIAGKNKFQESCSVSSCTKTISHVECEIDGTTVKMVDTPGSFDTDTTNDDIATEILKVGMLFKEGVHLFVFVKNLGDCRFNEQETQAFKSIKNMFGDKALSHCVFLFTHASNILEMKDVEEKTINGYLEQSLRSRGDVKEKQSLVEVKQIFASIGNRVIGVENNVNNEYEQEIQRRRLLSYFRSTVADNTPQAFILPAFEAAKAEYEKRVAAKRGPESKDSMSQKTSHEVDRVVSDYLESKTNGQMKNILRGNIGNAVANIVRISPHLGEFKKEIEIALESRAEVLTDGSFLGKLKSFATIVFQAAGVVGKFLGKFF